MVNWKKELWRRDHRYVGRLYGRRRPFDWRGLKFWNTTVWDDLREALSERVQLGYTVLPDHPTNQHVHYKKIFRALEATPYSQTRIIILGQDPYYTRGLADGLAFSVPPNIKRIPGTLDNIFKEYKADLGYKYPLTGDLTPWTRSGVLLLNTLLTVEEGKPKKHYRIKGRYLWQELIVEILDNLSKRKDRLVYMLWGKVAQEMRYMIDEKKHLVLIGPHPSPRNYTLTSNDGLYFRGGKYFSKACEYLNLPHSIWKLP